MTCVRGILAVLVCLLVSFGAHAEVLWNKPRVAPYTGTPELALEKMAGLVHEQNVWDTLLVMVRTREGCTRTSLVPGLQMAAMMSGKDIVLPNVRVGDWAGTTTYPTGAWSCRAVRDGIEYYVLIPDVCGNIALVVIRSGICVPNPERCEGDCATYAQKYIS